jgi:hypothetical protein
MMLSDDELLHIEGEPPDAYDAEVAHARPISPAVLVLRSSRAID